MERTIRTLKEMREKSERNFIDDSIIVMNAKGIDRPIPDTQFDLEMIAELNQAISVLENVKLTIPVVSQQRELLIDFMNKTQGKLIWGWDIVGGEKLADEYLKGNL